MKKNLTFIFDWYFSNGFLPNGLLPVTIGDAYLICVEKYWNQFDDDYKYQIDDFESDHLIKSILNIDKKRKFVNHPKVKNGALFGFDWTKSSDNNNIFVPPSNRGDFNIKCLPVSELYRDLESHHSTQLYIYPVEVLGGWANLFTGNSKTFRNDDDNSNFTNEKENIFETMSKISFDMIQGNQMYMLISYLHEGRTHLDDYRILHENLDNFNMNPEMIIFISGDYNVHEHYNSWCDNKKIHKRIQTISSDHIYGESARNCARHFSTKFDSKITRFGYTSAICKESDVNKIKSQIREKHFLSYNRSLNHGRPHRILFVTALELKKLFDKGFVSAGAPVPIQLDFWEDNLYENEVDDYTKTWSELSVELPRYLDMTDFNTPGEWGFDLDYLPHYLGSYFSVVTETAYYDTNLFPTEKIFKPITNLHPFIVLGEPFMLKKLRELGYKTFSPFIDETYDEVVNHRDRFHLVVNEVERLCNLKKEELHEWYYSILKDVLIHNQEILIERSRVNGRVEIFNKLYDLTWEKEKAPGEGLC